MLNAQQVDKKKASWAEMVGTSHGLGPLLALEPRIMFDGAAFVTGAEVANEQVAQDLDVQGVEADGQLDTLPDPFVGSIDLVSALSIVPTLTDRKEIVFIDTSVEDYHTLLLGIDPSAEAILLDSTRDGIEQVAEILEARSDIDAIHIISHGDQGELRLGTGVLNLATMQGEYADELATINQALTDEADWLIYGCNFGASEIGQKAATLLAKLTGADIAASNDLTGSADLGGDWDLEVETGKIETLVVINAEVQQVWSGILADGDTTVSFQEGVDGYTGTQDTFLDEIAPSASQGTGTALKVENNPGTENHTLIRFDNLFGSGAGQVPVGATIISASLTLDVTNPSDPGATVSLYRMLSTWDETSTWNSLSNGIQTDDVEASSTVDAIVVDPGSTGSITITGLETSLQAWADGVTNYGWAMKSDSTNGLDVRSSEDGTNSVRPQLRVEYQTTGGDITTGLVGLWNVDANADDSSGNINHGTLTGGALVDTTDLTDKVGAGKLSLDGTDDYVDLNSHLSNFSSLTEGTISAWVKLTAQNERAIFSVSDGGDARSFATFGAISGTIYYRVDEGGSTILDVNSGLNRIDDNAWHHVAVTVDGTGNKMFLDGIQLTADNLNYVVGSASSTPFFDDVTDLDTIAIGRQVVSSSGRWYFNGLMDDVRVYNRPLSVADIAAVAAEAPVATNDAATTGVDTAVNVNVIANDTDFDSETITVLDVGNPTNGTVVNNDDGTVTYTPTTSYAGGDNFTYLTADLDDTVSYWRLDGNGTDAVASNDGTLTGTTTVTGVYGNALSFDESDDKVIVPDFAINNEFSLSFKMKIDDNTGTRFQYLYGHGAINGFSNLNIFLVEASHFDPTAVNKLRTWIRDANDATGSNTALEFDASSIIGDGQWHIYTVTVAAGAGTKVYLDGVLKNTDTTRGGDAIDPGTAIHFGAREDFATVADRLYGGSLDSVQLFNRALSVEEVNDANFGGSSLGTVNVTVLEPPVITNLGGDTLAYTEGDGAQVIEQSSNAAVTDVDSSNFDTGTLTVAFAAGSTPGEDVLSIRDQGAGASNITVAGSAVSYGGTQIGTVTGGTSGTALVITLDSNADATATAALIQNITYTNTNTDTSSTSARTVRYVLTDGDGGTSANYDTMVTFSAVNDAPVNTIPSNEFTAVNTALVFSNGNSNLISVSDVDADSNDLEVTLTVTNGTLTLAGTAGLTFTVGNGATDSTMTVTGTTTAINTALNGLIFTPTISFRGLAQLTVATDDQGFTGSGGAQTDMDTVDIHVGALVVTNTTDVSNGTVTSKNALIANDGGDGISLREAITVANAEAGTDYIYFQIADALVSGAHTITPISTLPTITDTVILDGTTDTDYAVGVPVIEIDGSAAGGGVTGLVFTADNNTARGLVINRFSIDAMEFNASDGNIIEGNFIGVDPDGMTDQGNTLDGIWLRNGSDNNRIGGTTVAQRNVISGNGSDGIDIDNVTGAVVEGNYIGLAVDGSTIISNDQRGIYIRDGVTSTTIGGTTAAQRNVISGSGSDGIEIINSDGNSIIGNYIGTDASGTLNRGNTNHGIVVDGTSANNDIGGTAGGDGNRIIHNGGDGISLVGSGTGNAMLSNTIHSNAGLGIDLTNNGVTANDANDADTGTGPNNLQNFAVLTEVDIDSPTQITIAGTLATNGLNQDYRIEFFKNTIVTGEDPSNHGEGEIYLGFITVTTDGSGDGTFSTTLTATVAAGEFITATATVDSGGGNYGDTSEFGLNVAAAVLPEVPVITNLGGDMLAYTEGDGAQVIEQSSNAAVTDVDSSNFDTGTLTVAFQAGSTPGEDVLSIRAQGAGPTNITVAGSVVSYGGTQIGTFTGGTSGTALVITLDSNADATATAALIQNITYTNTNAGTPSTSARTVRYVLADGDGGTSADYDTTVTVTAVNDAPDITSHGRGVRANLFLAETLAEVTTITATDLDGDPLTYSLVGGADAALFTLNPITGALRFVGAPDFEIPTDAGSNNVYEVQVQVSDGQGGTDTQLLAISVTDVLEGLTPLPPAPEPSSDPIPDSILEPELEPMPKPLTSETSMSASGAGHGYVGEAAWIGRGPEDSVRQSSIRAVGKVLELPPLQQQDSRATPAAQFRSDYPDPLDIAKPRFPHNFFQQLHSFSHELKEGMDEEADRIPRSQNIINGAIVALSSGFVAWLVRGGTLVAAMMATLPTWRHFDPVPILNMSKKEKEVWSRRVSEADTLEAHEHQGLSQVLQGSRPESSSEFPESTDKFS